MRVALARRLVASRGLSSTATAVPAPSPGDEDEFRVLDFLKRRERVTRPSMKREAPPPPRSLALDPAHSWANVWPGPRTFHPGTVPLPLRQGYPLRAQVPLPAHANAELMKIPNFLHLTPPAVRAQCEALKAFCTPWPANLDVENQYPVEVITSDYCHSGPSIRDPLSRIVSVRLKLSHLTLDKHAKDKLCRIVGDRYDEKTDVLTIVTDRCPVRKQNFEYAQYLLTAIYHESWTVEPWEKEKTEADMEVYIWKNNQSKKSIIDLYSWKLDEKKSFTDDDYNNYDLTSIPNVAEYEEAVSDLINVGENDYQTKKYKRAALKLLGFPTSEQLPISDSNKK